MMTILCRPIALAILGAAFAVVPKALSSEDRASTFGQGSRYGATSYERVRIAQVTGQSLDKVKAVFANATEAYIYCAATPGPRFLEVDGEFFALNGKARRKKSFVRTKSGAKVSVVDMFVGDSFRDSSGLLSPETMTMTNALIAEAGEIC